MPKKKPLPPKRKKLPATWDAFSKDEIKKISCTHGISDEFDLYGALEYEATNYFLRKKDRDTQIDVNSQRHYLDKMISRSEEMSEALQGMNDISLFQLFDEGAFVKEIAPSLGISRIRKTPDRKKKDYLLDEINAINRAAKKARKKLKGKKDTKDIMRDHFFHRIGSLWEEATGKKAIISKYNKYSTKAGQPCGPFFPFLKDLYELFGLPTIKDRALAKAYDRAIKES